MVCEAGSRRGQSVFPQMVPTPHDEPHESIWGKGQGVR